MKTKSRVFFILGLGLLLAGFLAATLRDWWKGDGRPILRVLTYSSFFGPFGPGGEVRSRFESKCGCRLEWINAGSGLILAHETLGGWAHPPDVVLGLNAFEVERADAPDKWISLTAGAPFVSTVRGAVRERFLPYDYAPISWITRDENLAKAKSWSELLNLASRQSLSLPDPRTSSLGLDFLHWWSVSSAVHSQEALELFRKVRHGFAPNWESSYGLFQSGVTLSALSYLTSLAFHWFEGKDPNVKALSFDEGHPLSVEFVGVSVASAKPELAKSFVAHLLQNDMQTLIARRNYMLPAMESAPLPEGWERLPELKILPFSFVTVERQEDLLRQFREWP